MIKRILISLLLFCALGIGAVMAQANDNVDVKAIVKNQISAARAKEKEKVSTNTNISTEFAAANVKESGSSTLFIKLSILVFAGIIATFWVIKRRSDEQKIKNVQQLKKNIKLVREEKFIKEIDPKLKAIRTSLYLNSSNLNPVGKGVSQRAKALQIAKGELLLASRIRLYTTENNLERTYS